MTLRVLQPGLQTLLVDFGRPSSRSFGVPVGGAADRFSLAIGNALVGNPPDAPAVEISLAGPTLVADEPLSGVVFGAPFSLTIGKQGIEPGKTFNLISGEELYVGGAVSGMRAYLCVAGGFEARVILNSRTSLQPLQAGDELRCETRSLAARFIHPSFRWNATPSLLRVLDGAQADWFDLPQFLTQEYKVSPASNRTGLRLSGPPLPAPNRELVSEPVCPGTVQIMRDGQPVVLGVDGGTIGGYPKIAQVISADLDKLGQLRPGEPVRLERVTLEVAEQFYLAKRAELHEWLTRLGVTIGKL